MCQGHVGRVKINDVVCLTFYMDNVYAVSFTQPMILLREKWRNWFISEHLTFILYTYLFFYPFFIVTILNIVQALDSIA